MLGSSTSGGTVFNGLFMIASGSNTVSFSRTLIPEYEMVWKNGTISAVDDALLIIPGGALCTVDHNSTGYAINIAGTQLGKILNHGVLRSIGGAVSSSIFMILENYNATWVTKGRLSLSGAVHSSNGSFYATTGGVLAYGGTALVEMDALISADNSSVIEFSGQIDLSCVYDNQGTSLFSSGTTKLHQIAQTFSNGSYSSTQGTRLLNLGSLVYIRSSAVCDMTTWDLELPPLILEGVLTGSGSLTLISAVWNSGEHRSPPLPHISTATFLKQYWPMLVKIRLGYIGGAGSTIVSGTLNISTTSTKTFNRPTFNYGVVNWNQGSINQADDASFTNMASGVLYADPAGSSLLWTCAGNCKATFVNYGQIITSKATSTYTFR